MTTSDVVSRARAALDGTTEGPWRQNGEWIEPPGPRTSEVVAGEVWHDPDAEFIAWARTGVPALVAEVESLREQVDAARVVADHPARVYVATRSDRATRMEVES